MATYSTAEAARLIKVSKGTLLRWLQSGTVAGPKKQSLGGVEVRIWSERDLERIRKYREENYAKKPRKKES
jgi:excisionase family DNA binding protein